MNQLTEVQKSRFFWISFPALCTVSIALIILTIIPQSRELIRSLIVSQSRVILAKIEAEVTPGGPKLIILKVKTADTLAIEIFSRENEDSNQKFRRRIVLDENRDAYFNFRGNATNLAFSDIDNDGSLEIIAPTFDQDLVPHLNLYKYDSSRADFFKLGPENFSL